MGALDRYGVEPHAEHREPFEGDVRSAPSPLSVQRPEELLSRWSRGRSRTRRGPPASGRRRPRSGRASRAVTAVRNPGTDAKRAVRAACLDSAADQPRTFAHADDPVPPSAAWGTVGT